MSEWISTPKEERTMDEVIMLIFSNNYCWLKKTSNDKVANDDFLRGKPCKGGYSGFRNFHVYFGIKPTNTMYEQTIIFSQLETSDVLEVLTVLGVPSPTPSLYQPRSP